MMGIQSERKPLNDNLVLCPHRACSVKLISVEGILHLCILWRKQSVTVLGNAPSVSRKRAEMIFPALHAFFIVASRRCNESVVERPGLPLKWVFGRRL